MMKIVESPLPAPVPLHKLYPGDIFRMLKRFEPEFEEGQDYRVTDYYMLIEPAQVIMTTESIEVFNLNCKTHKKVFISRDTLVYAYNAVLTVSPKEIETSD